mgnify:FL=1
MPVQTQTSATICLFWLLWYSEDMESKPEQPPTDLNNEIANNERRLKEVRAKIVEIRMNLHRDQSGLNLAKRLIDEKASDKHALSLFLGAERDLMSALAKHRKERGL